MRRPHDACLAVRTCAAQLPARRRLRCRRDRCSTRGGWALHRRRRATCCSCWCPVCNLLLPAGHPFHVSDYRVTLVGKIMCYAIVALAMDLIWGYTGILSLGHGLFFALGGYAMGMYLMRSIGRDGVYQSDLPDFMVFLDWKAYPWYWSFTDHFWYAALLVVLVPGLLAFVFGYFAFRSRIKGVYFSIITQALTYAFMLLFFRNDTGFGGNNGFTDFKRILGFPDRRAGDARGALHGHRRGAARRRCCSAALHRDVEARPGADGDPRRREPRDVLRLQPAPLQALRLDAVRGHLRHRRRAVRAAGRHHQSERDVAGELDRDRDLDRGRRPRHADRARSSARSWSTAAKSWFTQALPEYWLFVLGLLFILVTLFLPRGVVGLCGGGERRRRTARDERWRRAHASTAARPGSPRRRHARSPAPGVDTTHGPILYLDGITVSFDGFKALNDLSLTIEDGELRCIIGPNGAGKTTMMDVITGKTRPDTGTAFFGQTIDLTR